MVEQLTITKIAIAAIPPIIWLLIFLLEDTEHPEPKRMIIKTFLAGSLGGYMLYITLEKFLIDIIINYINHLDYRVFILIFILAFLEEITKFIAVYLVIFKSKFFDEPVDAMIYLITGAMGFAAIENLIKFANIEDSLSLTIVRFFTAVLIHALATGIIGFYWMKGKLILGILFAILAHGIFNSLIHLFEYGLLYTLWLLIILGFVIIHDFDIIKSKWKKKLIQ